MSQGFELRDVLACASSLVIHFGIVAGGAGVPQGDIVAAGEAVIVVVEVLCVVHRGSAAICQCGAGRLPRRLWRGGKNDFGEQSKQKGWGSTGDH